jgi:hypothetical protein
MPVSSHSRAGSSADLSNWVPGPSGRFPGVLRGRGYMLVAYSATASVLVKGLIAREPSQLLGCRKRGRRPTEEGPYRGAPPSVRVRESAEPARQGQRCAPQGLRAGSQGRPLHARHSRRDRPAPQPNRGNPPRQIELSGFPDTSAKVATTTKSDGPPCANTTGRLDTGGTSSHVLQPPYGYETAPRKPIRTRV